MKQRTKHMLIGWCLALTLCIAMVIVLVQIRGKIVDKKQLALDRSLADRTPTPFHSLQTGDMIICAQPRHGLTPFHVAAVDHVGIVIRLSHMDQIMVAHARFATPAVVMVPLSNFANIDTTRHYYVRTIHPPLPRCATRSFIQSVQSHANYQYNVAVSFDFASRQLQSLTTLPPSIVGVSNHCGEKTYCTLFAMKLLEDAGIGKTPINFVMPHDFLEDDFFESYLTQPYKYAKTTMLSQAF